MLFSRIYLTVLLLEGLIPVYGQVYIQRFIPGNFLSDNNHRIEFNNLGKVPEDISGYLLVTRDYSVKLPPKTVIYPNQSFVITKKIDPTISANLLLTNVQDFKLRLYSRKVEGNYIILFDKNSKIIDAFYNSQLRVTPMLPDSDYCMVDNRIVLPFKVPAENSPVWKYFPVGDDPAIGFEQVNGNWRVIPAKPGINLYPAVAFKDLEGRFIDGGVTLRWLTQFEEGVEKIVIERSINQTDFTAIGTVDGQGTTNTITAYTFIDLDVKPKVIYYYRLKHRDNTGSEVLSKLIEVSTDGVAEVFWLNVFPTTAQHASEITIRFYSAYSNLIKIKLMDFQHREVAILFRDFVYADTQNLLRLKLDLMPGNYLILATTPFKRFVEKFTILTD